MRLSAIQTADQLVMALVKLGYRHERDWLSATPSTRYYFYWESKCRNCESSYRGICIYPVTHEHHDSYGIEAGIDHNENVISWSMVEHEVGSAQPMVPGFLTLHPDSLGERLQAWVESWGEFSR